jgi:hypothetical protein
MVDSDRRKHSGIPAGQHSATAKYRFASRDISSGKGNPCAWCDGPGDMELASANISVLDHYNGIGPAWNHAASGNRHRFAGFNYGGRDNTCVNLFFGYMQRASCLLGRSESVLRHHSEPIDVGTIEERDVDERHDVSRQHPSECCVERDCLNAARREVDGGPETAVRFIAI